MEIKKTKGKELDNWYEKQYKVKEREVKTALKDYEKGIDEERRRQHCTSENECVNGLDELRKECRK